MRPVLVVPEMALLARSEGLYPWTARDMAGLTEYVCLTVSAAVRDAVKKQEQARVLSPSPVVGRQAGMRIMNWHTSNQANAKYFILRSGQRAHAH